MSGKKSYYSLLIFCSLLITLNQCGPGLVKDSCLDEPESDATYPTAEVTIEYFMGNQKQTVSFNQEDDPVIVKASKNKPLSIVYAGKDEQGMKSIYLSAIHYREILGKQQKHEYNILPISADCPREKIEDIFKPNESRNTGTLKIQVKSTNWMNMQSQTKEIAIQLE
ncbi:MAG: hypothetical protein JXR46_13120 [Calditrichaceae bacterium]|nr:hypothetical protein [Calditrichaceae bacterium]MBN2709976.1 hypothetical protein [Calditrichaceae bacterium]RQV97315.1 MAG: hypothetical protein EH224_01860 [Calditrichota bacterium]